LSESNERFECWGVVEVMGHRRFSGKVSEQSIGGASFVRVDVPAVEGRLPFTKLLGAGSIYCITPCSEAVARADAAQSYDKPVTIYSPSMHLALPFDEGGDEEDGD
jgi:hypothetical protein